MYRALLVCNSIYPDDPVGLRSLHGAQVDGLYLWRQLTDPETGMFSEADVMVLIERGQREVFEAAENFFKGAKSGDTLLFYFSGHGYPAGGSLYLCLRDSVTSRVRSTGISTDELGKVIDDSHAESIVIVLDCCYSGAFKGKAAATLTGRGRYVISAATSVDVANDSNEVGAPSPFTEALVESLLGGAEDSDLDGFVDVDDIFRDLEARLGEEYSRPERDFDGAGRVTIAKRLARRGPAEADGYDDSVTPSIDPPNSLAQLSYFRNLSLARRRQGDFSLADMHGSTVSVILSCTLIVCASLALRYVYTEHSDQYSSHYLPETVAAAIAILVGVIHLALGLVERRQFEKRLPRRLSRRRFLLSYDQPSAKILRRIQMLFTIPVIALCLGPLSTRGFVTSSWVSMWTVLALMALVMAARWSRLGDSALVASASLLVLGNCIPFEFDPGPGRDTGFYSGLESTSGVVVFGVGLLMICAWWWRASTPILTIFVLIGLLSSVTSAADAFGGNNPHWFLSVIALAVAGLTLVLGACQLLPLKSTLQKRSELGPEGVASGRG